jgi:hypothetical protein
LQAFGAASRFRRGQRVALLRAPELVVFFFELRAVGARRKRAVHLPAGRHTEASADRVDDFVDALVLEDVRAFALGQEPRARGTNVTTKR